MMIPPRHAAPMSPAQQAVKLQQINSLTLAEIEGWRDALRLRAPFPGELSALLMREKELRRD